MPDLGDFLGALLGELTEARLQGDVEALRVADIYANHELLKHLPVPRFRLPEVRIDFPAIIEGGADEAARPIDIKKTSKTVLGAMRRKLDEAKISLTRAEDTRLAQTVGQVLDDALLSSPPLPAHSVADRVLNALRAISSGAAAEDNTQVLQQVKGEVAWQLVVARAAAARISILPQTGAVREVPDTDRLIRIHLVVSEEAVEWMVLETASGAKERLVQE